MRHVALCVSLAAAALAALAAPAAAQQQAPIQYLTTDPSAPFSQLVRVGNTVYLSGMLGTAANGALAPGGIQPETKQALENIRSALAKVDATLGDIVKCTVFLADMDEWAPMNEVYVTFFPGHRPARSAVGVNGLARDARVEIECVAVIGARSAT